MTNTDPTPPPLSGRPAHPAAPGRRRGAGDLRRLPVAPRRSTSCSASAASAVGLATVYRTLQRLADAGEVDMLRTEDGEAIYRRCSDTHHHHLVCRVCGATVEVEGPAVERWTRAIAASTGTPTSATRWRSSAPVPAAADRQRHVRPSPSDHPSPTSRMEPTTRWSADEYRCRRGRGRGQWAGQRDDEDAARAQPPHRTGPARPDRSSRSSRNHAARPTPRLTTVTCQGIDPHDAVALMHREIDAGADRCQRPAGVRRGHGRQHGEPASAADPAQLCARRDSWLQCCRGHDLTVPTVAPARIGHTATVDPPIGLAATPTFGGVPVPVGSPSLSR